MRLRSWLEQNADSGGSMNAKSHITTFKWRHINAFPVHLSSNNSLEQCAVHAHEIVFFSREAWTVLPWRAFWIGVLNPRFKTLILPSQNKHERSLSMDATAFCSNHVWKRWFWPQKLSINAPLEGNSKRVWLSTKHSGSHGSQSLIVLGNPYLLNECRTFLALNIVSWEPKGCYH